MAAWRRVARGLERGAALAIWGASRLAGPEVVCRLVRRVPGRAGRLLRRRARHPVLRALRAPMRIRVGGPLGGQTMLLDPGDRVEHDIFFHGVWEPHTAAWLLDRLRPGCVFVDAGAHAGYFTLLAARATAPDGLVVAFEPVWTERLRQNVGENGWRHVRIRAEALGERDGSVELGLAGSWNTGQTSGVLLQRFGRRVSVPQTTLDRCVAREALARVDVLKVDVEGMEAAVLRGARRLLRGSAAPDIVFEVTPRYLEAAGASAAELMEELGECGYRLFRLAPGTGREAYALTPLRAMPADGQFEAVALRVP